MQSVQTHLFKYLDLLPDLLYAPVVTHTYGKIEDRCLGVLHWREQLIQGVEPDSSVISWPEAAELEKLIRIIRKHNILKGCKNQIQKTDQFLLDVLRWLENEDVDFSRYKPEENQHQDQSQQKSTPHTDEQQHQYKEEKLDALSPVLKDFGVERRLGWDYSKGLLVHTEWKQVLKIHKSLKKSQYLKNIISLIGRDKRTKIDSSKDANQIKLKKQSKHKQLQQHKTNYVPIEASGITRSDDVGRMLPGELLALGHKKLKMLWHAKRAERMLLSYQYEGVYSEHLPIYETQTIGLNEKQSKTTLAKGPIIICLDTSASMKGSPEETAKAITLETMRVAMQEKRPCYLFAFSGPDEVHEYELNIKEEGWDNILDIISMSFHGGTDLSSVIHRAFDKLKVKQYINADCLLVSDSRFYVDPELIALIDEFKTELGVKFYGINVSKWKSTSMEKICEPVYKIPNL